MGQRGPGEQLTWAGGAAHGGLAVAPSPDGTPAGLTGGTTGLSATK